MLALGFGAGLAPRMPGTFGTLIAMPAAWGLGFLPVMAQVAVVVAISLVGVPLCHRSAHRLGVDDHPGIVWDEIAGFLLACIALPPAWYWLPIAFVVFRALDIAKPFPIGWVDRRVHGGLGIMLDDLIAGAMTLAILQLAHRLTLT